MQHACIFFIFIHWDSYQFTAQIFANIFNNSTQRLAAVATSSSPIVRSQRQPILQHTLACTWPYSWARPAYLNLGQKTGGIHARLAGKYWMRAFRVKIYRAARVCFSVHSAFTGRRAPASRYIVAFIQNADPPDPWNRKSIWSGLSVKKLERSYAGLMRSVSYFMRSVIYFMRPSVTLWSWSALADSHQGVWQAGHKSRPSVGKYKNTLIFHPYKIL